MSNRIFDIIGSAGATHVHHLHPTQRAIAYESGCYITLWDLEIDKKLMIHPHDSTVTCVRFFGQNSEYLLSIDSGYKPSIFITEWQTMTRLHQIYLPVSKDNQRVVSFELTYCPKTNIIIIVANYKDHYSLSLWDFKADNLALVASNKEDSQEICLGVHSFDDTKSTFFAVAEKKMIKYWRYANHQLELLNRIHIKEEIVDTAVSNLTQFLLFTTRQGRLYIINKEGQFISSIKHPNIVYSCLGVYSDYIFLGSKDGEIDIYQLSSMKFIKSLKGVSNAVKAKRTSQTTEKKTIYSSDVYKFAKDPQEASEIKPSQRLTHISIAKSTGLLTLKYADNNIFIYNMEKDKVLYSISGHSKKVNEVLWDKASKKSFITSSSDGTVRVWNYAGDRWESFSITPSLPLHAASSLSTIGDKSFQGDDVTFNNAKEFAYKITCMQVDWTTKEIFTGDNQGCLNIYDLATGETKHSVKVSGFKLKEISLGASFIGIAFSNGSCVIIERQRSFETYIKLEEPRMEVGNKQKILAGIRFLEKDGHLKGDKYHKESPVMFQSKYGVSQSRDSFYGSEYRKETSQRVITVHNANSLRLHQVVLNQGYLNSIVLAKYSIPGKVVDYALHISNDYLLVLSNEDLIYFFQVSTGEIKGTIETPRFSQKISCDPAGLYIIIVSPFVSADAESRNERASVLRTSFSSPIKDRDFNRNINRDQSVLSIFEMWTGEYVGQIHRIQTVASLGFSYEGSYLTVGTSMGAINVLALDEGLRENIYAALEGMQQNSLFWTDFQLTFGDRKLPTEVLGDYRQTDKSNVSQLSEDEIRVNPNDVSRSLPRSPKSYSETSQKPKLLADRQRPDQLRTPPSEKTPTMKDYLANQKIHKSIQSQNLSPTVIMITGEKDRSNPAFNKRESQISKSSVPNVPIRNVQEQARSQAEQIRAKNFTRKDSEKSESVGWENAGVKMFTENEQQTTPPRYNRPFDKVIDLVSESNKKIQSGDKYRANYDNRKIQPDPDDIDDEYEAEHSHEYHEEDSEKRIPRFISQMVDNSAIVEDASGVYEDLSEFERKFQRNNDSSY